MKHKSVRLAMVSVAVLSVLGLSQAPASAAARTDHHARTTLVLPLTAS